MAAVQHALATVDRAAFRTAGVPGGRYGGSLYVPAPRNIDKADEHDPE
jgi:hypothetical protein